MVSYKGLNTVYLCGGDCSNRTFMELKFWCVKADENTFMF